MLGIMQGPQTRLAKTLMSLDWPAVNEWILIGRSPAEIAKLKEKYPEANMISIEQNEKVPPLEADRIVLCCCAMGPLHVHSPNMQEDINNFSRDMNMIKRLVESFYYGKLHIIFISSALVFLVSRKRMYYAGWKCIIESALDDLSRRYPRRVTLNWRCHTL